MRDRTDRDFVDFWLAIVSAPDWQSGFQAWSGRSVLEFAIEFARARAEGFPQPGDTEPRIP